MAEKSALVDALFDSWIRPDTPGAAVIVIQNGRILHNKAYGLCDLETKSAMMPNTSFRLASLAKQFTAMAIMILAETGKLEYDQAIARFLSGFRSYDREITIRHLLNHTSGLEDYEDLFLQDGKIDRDYPRSSKQKADDFEPTSKDVLSLLADEMLRFSPGEIWDYSNSGYVVLAQIVERVSDRPFSQFLGERIFLPLGMNDSLLCDETRPDVPNRATSYKRNEGVYEDVDYTPLNLIYGQDGIYSTPDDMTRWCQSLERETLVKRSTALQGFATGRLNVGASTGYGFGWFTGNWIGVRRVSHTGSWAGFRHFLVYYPEAKLSALVLSNLAGFDDVARSATAAALGEIYLSDRLKLPEAVTVQSERLKECAGTYELENGELLDLTVDDKALRLRSPSLLPLRLLPESEVKFFVDGARSDYYFFNRDEKGLIKSLTRHLSLFSYTTDAYTRARKVE